MQTGLMKEEAALAADPRLGHVCITLSFFPFRLLACCFAKWRGAGILNARKIMCRFRRAYRCDKETRMFGPLVSYYGGHEILAEGFVW